jgi:superfamily II DNA helicase RecQ
MIPTLSVSKMSTMKYQIFQVPIPCDDGTTEINQFIACHRITSVRQYVVRSEEAPILVFVVEYGEEDKRSQRTNSVKIDYREILTADQFVGFSRLRDLRKKIAEHEGVPVYTVFTNAQLAAIVQSSVRTVADLHEINGLGKARIDKFGLQVIAIISDLTST